MPPKRTSQKRRPASRRRAKPKSAGKGILRLLLQVLVVLLSLALIAFAASYVYLRKQANNDVQKDATAAVQNNPSTALVAETEEHLTQKAQISVLEGTWVSVDNGTMLSFAAENYSIDFPSVEAGKPIKGTFTVKGKRLNMLSSDAPGCEAIQGNYTFTIEGEDLQIFLKEDACTKRSNALVSNWFKL